MSQWTDKGMGGQQGRYCLRATGKMGLKKGLKVIKHEQE